MHWRGIRGTWRQSFFNRLTEATFPPFSAPGALARGGQAALRRHRATLYARPLSVISGGGKFYDFNLDFGCCASQRGRAAFTLSSSSMLRSRV